MRSTGILATAAMMAAQAWTAAQGAGPIGMPAVARPSFEAHWNLVRAEAPEERLRVTSIGSSFSVRSGRLERMFDGRAVWVHEAGTADALRCRPSGIDLSALQFWVVPEDFNVQRSDVVRMGGRNALFLEGDETKDRGSEIREKLAFWLDPGTRAVLRRETRLVFVHEGREILQTRLERLDYRTLPEKSPELSPPKVERVADAEDEKAPGHETDTAAEIKEACFDPEAY